MIDDAGMGPVDWRARTEAAEAERDAWKARAQFAVDTVLAIALRMAEMEAGDGATSSRDFGRGVAYAIDQILPFSTLFGLPPEPKPRSGTSG